MKKKLNGRIRKIVIGSFVAMVMIGNLSQTKASAADDESELVEVKRYTDVDGYANHIAKAKDGGFFVAAKHGENLAVIRLNHDGEKVGTYLSGEFRYNNALIATSDGGCVVISIKTEGMFVASYVRKFKSDLTLEYEQKIENMMIYSIIENDEGYLLGGGLKDSTLEISATMQIGRTGVDTDVLWTKQYGVASMYGGVSNLHKIEMGYVAKSDLSETERNQILFLDEDGNESMHIDFGTSRISKIQVLDNGKIMVAILTYDNNTKLMELDNQGNILWENDSYNYKQGFAAIKEVEDGYVLLGERNYKQYAIAKVSKVDGALLWSKDIKKKTDENQFKPYDLELINSNEFIIPALSGNNPAIIHYKYQLKPSEVPTYVVSFDTVGGNTIAPQTIQENKLLSNPGIPTKIGYKFEGWLMSNGENWDLDSNRVTEALLLTAKWSPITPTFNEIPGQIYVGDTFTLNPSIDGLIGETGWTYDKSILSATFNSPATFTALKVGKTTVMFSAINGQTVSMEINVLALDKKSASTKPTSVGTNDNVDVSLLSLLLLGSALLISCRLLKKSE